VRLVFDPPEQAALLEQAEEAEACGEPMLADSYRQLAREGADVTPRWSEFFASIENLHGLETG
jgi:hypothetical protein